MARNAQQLINYHGVNRANLEASASTLQMGEIAVVTKKGETLLATKDEERNIMYFITSGAVVDAINSIDEVNNTAIDSLSAATSAFSAAVIATYATSANTVGAINAVDGKVNDLSGITKDIKDDLDELSGAVGTTFVKQDDYETFATAIGEGVSATVMSINSDYLTSADKTELEGKISGATDDAISSAQTFATNSISTYSGYVSSALETLSSNTQAAIGIVHGETEANATSINNAFSAISAVSASVKTLSGNVVNYVDEKLDVINSAYVYKGSCTYANLPTTGQRNGDVWNVTDAVGQPGDSNYTPAGTNYAWVEADTEHGVTAHWDALGGVVDLSAYLKSDVYETFATAIGEGVSATVVSINSDYLKSSDKTSLQGEIGTAWSGAVASARSYTDTALESYATSADTVAAIGVVNGAVETNTTDIRNIKDWAASGITADDVTKMRGDVASVALGTVTGDGDSAQSGAKVAEDANHAVTLDLSELIIDCGTF